MPEILITKILPRTLFMPIRAYCFGIPCMYYPANTFAFSICSSFSPLKLVYQLFVTNLQPGEEDVKIVMEMSEESVRAQERDPYTAFSNRVREINYGNSYFFRVSYLPFLDSFSLYCIT